MLKLHELFIVSIILLCGSAALIIKGIALGFAVAGAAVSLIIILLSEINQNANTLTIKSNRKAIDKTCGHFLDLLAAVKSNKDSMLACKDLPACYEDARLRIDRPGLFYNLASEIFGPESCLCNYGDSNTILRDGYFTQAKSSSMQIASRKLYESGIKLGSMQIRNTPKALMRKNLAFTCAEINSKRFKKTISNSNDFKGHVLILVTGQTDYKLLEKAVSSQSPVSGLTLFLISTGKIRVLAHD